MSSHECPHCSKSFANHAHLHQHVESSCVWPDEQGLDTINKYICPQCTKSLDSATQLFRHLQCHKHVKSSTTNAAVHRSKNVKNSHTVNADRNQPLRIHELNKLSLCEEGQRVKRFQCDKCPRSYDEKIQLQNHISYHKRHREMFYCSRCSQFFYSSKSWKRHNHIHQCFDTDKRQGADKVGSIYSCSRCDRTFDCRFMFARHEQNHVQADKRKSRVFHCSRCARTFASSALLRGHEMSHSENGGTKNDHICQLCNKHFLHKSVLCRHMERVHCREELNKIGPVHDCSKCSEIFVEAERLRVHEKLVHPEMHGHSDRKDSSTVLSCKTANAYECSQCGKSFKSHFALGLHWNTHSGDRPYQCRAGCSRRFAQHSTRAYHERTHSDATPHICSQCGLAFKHSTMLRLHSRLHTGIRPHKCPSCPREFHRSSQLIEHVRYHTGERPYACATCSKQFTSRSQLVRHENSVHRQLKPWHCSVCDKAFTQPGNLRIHMRVHTREKPFVCSFCHLQFSYSGTLKSHMRIHEQREMK